MVKEVKLVLDEQDIALFQQAVQGVKKIKQDTVVLPYKVQKPKQVIREIRETEDTLFYFSDEYEPHLSDDGVVKYLRQGTDSHLLKQLRRGDFEPMLFLDLHGLTKEQAKKELAALILACEKENINCACIMTGYGTYTLKQQLPRWLVQHPKIIALHQAPKEWGGSAAILFLLDTLE